MSNKLYLCHEDDFSVSNQQGIPFNRQTFGNKSGGSDKKISSFENEKKRLNKFELDFYNFPLKIDKIIQNEPIEKKRNLSPPPLLLVDLGNTDKKSSVKSPRFPLDVWRNDEDQKDSEYKEKQNENEKFSNNNEKANPKEKKNIAKIEEKGSISNNAAIQKAIKKLESFDNINMNQSYIEPKITSKITKRDSKGDSQIDLNLSDISELDSKYMSASEMKELKLKPLKPEKINLNPSSSKMNRSISPFRSTKPPMGDLKKKDVINQERKKYFSIRNFYFHLKIKKGQEK